MSYYTIKKKAVPNSKKRLQFVTFHSMPDFIACVTDENALDNLIQELCKITPYRQEGHIDAWRASLYDFGNLINDPNNYYSDTLDQISFHESTANAVAEILSGYYTFLTFDEKQIASNIANDAIRNIHDSRPTADQPDTSKFQKLKDTLSLKIYLEFPFVATTDKNYSRADIVLHQEKDIEKGILYDKYAIIEQKQWTEDFITQERKKQKELEHPDTRMRTYIKCLRKELPYQSFRLSFT